MITKKINGGNFEPVVTGEIVLDSTPTVNSFNSVTSDGVARAIAGASGEVPVVTENDNGKVLTAVYDAGGAAVEWAEAQGGGSYTAGDGIAISEGEISAKVDGTTIQVNADGELEAIGGGGTSYTAGDGIAISDQNVISVPVDNKTLAVERPTYVYSGVTIYTDTNYLSLGLADLPTVASTSGISAFKLTPQVTTGGLSYTLRYDSETQTGLNVRVQIGNDSSFTKYATSTENAKIGNNPVVLGTTVFNLSDCNAFTPTMGHSSTTFGELFDFTGGDSFEDIFSGSSVYIRLVAWDSANGAVVGAPLTIRTTGYPNMRWAITTNAAAAKMVVKYNTNTLELSHPGNGYLSVKNPNPYPMPASLGTSGQVLSVNSGATGIEWATPSGGASYTSGDGISIDSNDKISAVVNTDTLSLVAEEVHSNAYGEMPITDISGISADTRITSFTYRFTQFSTSTSGYWHFYYDAGTQTGLNVRLQVGSDSNFTKYATSTEVVQIRDSSYNLTPVVLGTNSQGTDTLTMTRWGSTKFSDLFDFTNGDSFDDIFSGSSVYLRFVAWDSTNNVVVGDPLYLQTAYGSGYFYLMTDNNTKKIKVNIPVPRVGSASAGSVLTWDGSNIGWATPSTGYTPVDLQSISAAPFTIPVSNRQDVAVTVSNETGVLTLQLANDCTDAIVKITGHPAFFSSIQVVRGQDTLDLFGQNYIASLTAPTRSDYNILASDLQSDSDWEMPSDFSECTLVGGDLVTAVSVESPTSDNLLTKFVIEIKGRSAILHV